MMLARPSQTYLLYSCWTWIAVVQLLICSDSDNPPYGRRICMIRRVVQLLICSDSDNRQAWSEPKKPNTTTSFYKLIIQNTHTTSNTMLSYKYLTYQ